MHLTYLWTLLALLVLLLLPLPAHAQGSMKAVQWTQPLMCCPEVRGWAIVGQYLDEDHATVLADLSRDIATPNIKGIYTAMIYWDGLTPLSVMVYSYGDGGPSVGLFVLEFVPNSTPWACAADITKDGLVGLRDWVEVARNFGKKCER